MSLTDEQVELFAIRAALGNNGGTWADHYAEEHKEHWRKFVRDLARDVLETATETEAGNITADEVLKSEGYLPYA